MYELNRLDIKLLKFIVKKASPVYDLDIAAKFKLNGYVLRAEHLASLGYVDVLTLVENDGAERAAYVVSKVGLRAMRDYEVVQQKESLRFWIPVIISTIALISSFRTELTLLLRLITQ